MISLTSPLALGLLAAIRPVSRKIKRKHETSVSTKQPALEEVRRLFVVVSAPSAPEAAVIAAVEPVANHVNVMLGRPTSRFATKQQAVQWLEVAPKVLEFATDAKALVGIQAVAAAGVRSVSEAAPAKRLLSRAKET